MAEKSAGILIVENSPVQTRAFATALEKEGFVCLLADSAESALEILKEHPVDLVITDILLPGVNGLTFTRTIKTHHEADVIITTRFSERYTYEEAITMGASDFVIKPVRVGEMVLRAKRVLHARRLERERDKMLRQLEKLAITDGLTRLYNSRHFYQEIAVELLRFARYGRPLSLLLFDVDRFKRYNDLYGHLEGDKALTMVAQRTLKNLRKIDTAFRYGGEEFTVILPETGGARAVMAGKRILDSIAGETLTPKEGVEETLTVSVGVTEAMSGETKEDLVRRADAAMYVAKKAGGNQVAYLPPEAENASLD